MKWQPDWDDLLGTATDRELADCLGVHRRTVHEHRRLAGIPARRKWSAAARLKRSKSLTRARELVEQWGTSRGVIQHVADTLKVSYEWARQLVAEAADAQRQQVVAGTIARRGASDAVVADLAASLSLSRAAVVRLIAEVQARKREGA